MGGGSVTKDLRKLANDNLIERDDFKGEEEGEGRQVQEEQKDLHTFQGRHRVSRIEVKLKIILKIYQELDPF